MAIGERYCDYIIIDNPNVGHGKSLDRLLMSTQTKYVLNWEDDWRMLRDIDLTELVQLMNKYDVINQICFHKRKIMSEKKYNGGVFQKQEINYDGITLTTNLHWAFQPALWRKSFIMKYWIYGCGNNVAWNINHKMKGHIKNFDAKYVIENFGTYFYGGIGTKESYVLEHMGRDCSRLR
jgi:hypothetical protein